MGKRPVSESRRGETHRIPSQGRGAVALQSEGVAVYRRSFWGFHWGRLFALGLTLLMWGAVFYGARRGLVH